MTNDDQYDLYKISPKNDHGRYDRFLKKSLAELKSDKSVP